MLGTDLELYSMYYFDGRRRREGHATSITRDYEELQVRSNTEIIICVLCDVTTVPVATVIHSRCLIVPFSCDREQHKAGFPLSGTQPLFTNTTLSFYCLLFAAVSLYFTK